MGSITWVRVFRVIDAISRLLSEGPVLVPSGSMDTIICFNVGRKLAQNFFTTEGNKDTWINVLN